MTQNKKLTSEIIRHCFASFGLKLPLLTSGNVLSANEFLTSKSIKIEYDDDSDYKCLEHKVYSAEMVFNDKSKLKALLVDLSSLDEEYMVVFRVDNMPLHGLRLCYDNDDLGLFKMYNEKTKTWIDTPISIQALVLNGIEKIVDFGLLWNKSGPNEDLYAAAIALATL